MSPTARARTASTLVVLAAIGLFSALVTGYAARALLDSGEFSERAASTLQEEAVANEIGRRASEELIARKPDLVAVRPVIEEVIASTARSGAFRSLFQAATRDLHRAVLDQDESTATLTLIDIGATARGALMALEPKLGRQIPAVSDADVLDVDLPPLVVAAIEHRAVPWLLLGLSALLLGGGLALATDRRRSASLLGVALALSGVVGVVVLGTGEALLLSQIDAGPARDAAEAIWGAFLDDLRIGLLLLAACGAVVTAAASSLLRPVDVGAPLRRAWEAAARVPTSPGIRAARAVALVGLGVLIVARHEAFLDLIAILAGIYVAYAGASELMRMTIGHPQEEDQPRPGRAMIAVSAVSVLAIVVAGAAFVAVEGVEETAARLGGQGCNGTEDLCDRTLDEVVIPATHNSMSGATYPGYLFAQQEAGLTEQLNDGIRGLLIDAYYGFPTRSGRVKTDLSDIDGSKRKAIEDEIGTDALAAALRIRDRIVGSAQGADRGIYLCHGFCEVGAVEIEPAFAEIRDFLAANPQEVLVIVIEDYVLPEDIAAAVESSGLIDYVYMGPLGPELPTLREMIDSGGRVVMMAENDPGGDSIPWYHPVYRGLVQETPFSFRSPQALIGPGALSPSCEPNRGTGDSPLFLLNHWVDTSPAPRPSNAMVANAGPNLLARIRRCMQIRGLLPNLIAVDFYRQGDLLAIADELNSSATATGAGS